MATAIYLVHSLWGYLVFVAGLGAVGYALYGQMRNRPFDETMHRLGSSFALLLIVELFIGIALIFAGRFDPQSGPHILTMIGATACAYVPMRMMRGRPLEERSHAPLAVFGAIALALLVLGIAALGRPLIGI